MVLDHGARSPSIALENLRRSPANRLFQTQRITNCYDPVARLEEPVRFQVSLLEKISGKSNMAMSLSAVNVEERVDAAYQRTDVLLDIWGCRDSS